LGVNYHEVVLVVDLGKQQIHRMTSKFYVAHKAARVQAQNGKVNLFSWILPRLFNFIANYQLAAVLQVKQTENKRCVNSQNIKKAIESSSALQSK
jgi:hypothetical protein